MKKVAIIQSSYIPWKGFFDIMHDVDLFLLDSCAQFTCRDWRNRNRIKTPHGALWLTIPVGNQDQKPIREVTIRDGEWAKRHWKNIENFYRRAAQFKRYQDLFMDIYLNRRWDYLWELNLCLIRAIAHEVLDIKTEIRDTAGLEPAGRRQDRLIDLLHKVKGDAYVSGPGAKGYIDRSRFEEEGISLTYKNYSGYPEYRQFFPPFIHEVSILDMVFHLGPEAPYYVWGWRDQ